MIAQDATNEAGQIAPQRQNVAEQRTYVVVGRVARAPCPGCRRVRNHDLRQPLMGRVFRCRCGVRYRIVTHVEQRGEAR
jgi:hypothetical protein